MGLLDAFAGPGGNGEDGVNAFGNVLGAIGAGLLTGDRYNPIGPGFLASLQANARTGLPRAALKQILQNAGYSEADAEKLSASEGTAKLALQQKQQEKILGDGGEAEPPLYGGGAPAAPRMSPTAPTGPAAGATLNGGQTANAKAIYDGVIARGGSPMLASAVVGNFAKESSFDPTIGGDHRNGVPTSFGLGQWREGRLDALKSLGQQQGKDWRTTDVQLDHLFKELSGGDAGAARARSLIEQARTPEEAAAIFARHFERPSADALAKSLPGRQGVAAQAFRSFGQGAPTQVASAGAAPTTSQPQAPTGRPVQVAETEDDVQRLEGRMSMYPPSVYGATPELQRPQPARTADASSPDMPAPGAQEAGFVIPPAARESVERRVGSPPPPVNENIGPTTQKAQAIANYNYWAKRLRVSGTLGEAGKGLAEEAKQRMDLAAKFLAPTDTERLVDAAGLTGEERQRAIAGSISGNAPTDTQKNYGSYRQQELSEGRIPLSQIDYDMRLRQAGKTEVNIKNDAEKKEEVERAASVTKFLGGIADGAPATARRASDLDMLGRLISRTRTAQGTTLRATLDGIGKEIGLSSGELKTKADAINAIVNRLAPQMREPGTGTVSDADLRGFLAALPSLSATPEGNQLILGALKRATDVDRERTKIAAQWQAGKISASEARTKIGEIDERSIYASDAERSLVANLSPIPDNKAKPGWRVLGVE